MFNNLFNKEIRSLLFAALILGFVVSFRQWGYGEFSLSIGLMNFIRAFLLSFIVFSIYFIAVKTVSKLHGAKATFKIWSIERYWFDKSAKIKSINIFGRRFKGFSAGFFIPVLITIFTNGLARLSTIAYTEIKELNKGSLYSDSKQTTAGESIWRRLQQDPEVNVEEPSDETDCRWRLSK